MTGVHEQARERATAAEKLRAERLAGFKAWALAPGPDSEWLISRLDARALLVEVERLEQERLDTLVEVRRLEELVADYRESTDYEVIRQRRDSLQAETALLRQDVEGVEAIFNELGVPEYRGDARLRPTGRAQELKALVERKDEALREAERLLSGFTSAVDFEEFFTSRGMRRRIITLRDLVRAALAGSSREDTLSPVPRPPTSEKARASSSGAGE